MDTAPPWDVLVVDRYGTLRSCYAVADVVVIGGTFAAIGGHNLLEAAALARPILVGPHVDNIAAVVTHFEEAGALRRVSGSDPVSSLLDGCRTLLDDPARARKMGDAAGALCRAEAGSAARHARVIAALTTSRG
jgi:3-deoxy-D-manno-octulosonic-acid transferase